MKNAIYLFLFIWLFWSCSTSDPDEETAIIEVVEETTNVDVTAEEETEEETEEDDRLANFVYTSITIQPYYYPNSEIEYYYNEYGNLASRIVEGDRLVFKYYEAANDRIDTITGQRLADSAYRKDLLFAIDADKTEFKLEKADFSAASSKYGLFAFFPDSGYHDITDGFIEGVKINETEWEIAINIIWTVPANEFHAEDLDYDFELSSNFIPVPQE